MSHTFDAGLVCKYSEYDKYKVVCEQHVSQGNGWMLLCDNCRKLNNWAIAKSAEWESAYYMSISGGGARNHEAAVQIANKVRDEWVKKNPCPFPEAYL